MLNIAEINLNALKFNAIQIKKLLPKTTKFCAVVKADAYGHGAEEVASALYPYCDYFAVALVEEGVALKNSGIDKDVLVLIPPNKSEIQLAVRYGLTLTVCDYKQIQDILNCAMQEKKLVKIHLKVNTGMNRQGITATKSQVDKACKLISQSKWLILDGIYSHLAYPENEKMRKSQVDKFLLAIKVAKGYNNKVIAHLSASGGTLMGEYFDMVRIGIMLYGYTPFESQRVKLKKVMKVYAPIICKRKIGRKESALYGLCKAEKPCQIKLIRFGYADGLPRRKVSGQFNNRCMDITASVSCKTYKKDWAIVMQDATALAKAYRTITYEILCNVSKRAEKIFIR